MTRIAVAIAAFRSDAPVITLIRQIIGEEWPVECAFVVDSLGSGEIEDFILANHFQGRVRYHSSDTNLGAAGNFLKRMELAAELGVDYVLALNHDAVITRHVFDHMVACTQLENLGALYPLRFREGKQSYDLTGVAEFSFRIRGSSVVPTVPLIDVFWSSSNGALYSTAPFRVHRLCPDATLWHGWEDYLYGLQMHDLGYRQYIVVAAQTVDQYEYKQVRTLGRTVTLADKSSWILYYAVRNFLLVHLHRRAHPVLGVKAILWAGMMLIHVLMMRSDKYMVSPWRAYFCGFADGLLNRTGKWIYP
jgi:GT2 family glycosyltransferase